MDTWLDTRTQVQDTLAHNRQNPAYHSAYLAGAYRKTDLGGTAARNHLAASLPTEPESHDGKANVRYCNASAITHCPGRERCALCGPRSEEHTSELQSRPHLVCRLLLEKKNK